MQRTPGLAWSLAAFTFLLVVPAGQALAQRAAPMTRIEISQPSHPTAVCNDGTKPIMYTQPGTGDGRNKWVIYFQGGAGCATEAACLARSVNNHDLTSSVDDNLPERITPEGIISTVPEVNPDFATYNHVFLHYCSSDAYAGDGERKIGPATWQFRGKEIVAAMIYQLAEPTTGDPSLKDATEVLITGGSAGAMGVANNLDRIAERLAPVPVKGISDAGWMPYGMKPFGPGLFDVRPDAVAAYGYYNAKPDESCVAANPDNPGACLNQNFAAKYIKTPMYVINDQRDPQLLAVMGINSAPQTIAERDYVYSWGTQLRETLAASSPSYFVADYGRHTVLLVRQFNGLMAGGVPLGTVLHNWYFATPGPVTAMAPAPGTPGSIR